MKELDSLSQYLLQQLQLHPQGISEYQLLKQLRKQPWSWFSDSDLRDPLSLFRSHFLLFHLLYKLDAQLAEQDMQLQIHTLSIRLLTRTPGQPGLATRDPLRSYYLDLQQLADTDRAQVEAMLNGSLQRFHNQDELAQALAVLGLASHNQPSAQQIRTSFRQLVSKHHPDRGGDTAQLQRINQAMSVIKNQGLI